MNQLRLTSVGEEDLKAGRLDFSVWRRSGSGLSPSSAKRREWDSGFEALVP